MHGRESYGRADAKEYANEQKDKQDERGEGK
jgi:hypothetical protein